jgi:hypothetical protein
MSLSLGGFAGNEVVEGERAAAQIDDSAHVLKRHAAHLPKRDRSLAEPEVLGDAGHATLFGFTPLGERHARSLKHRKRNGQRDREPSMFNLGCMDERYRDERRRARFKTLFLTKYEGKSSKFLEASGLTKGRLSQMLKKGFPFGERAASAMAERLELRPDYFETDVIPALSPWAAELGALMDARVPENERETAYFQCAAAIEKYLEARAKLRSAKPRKAPVRSR